MAEIGSLVVTLEANMAQYATDMGRAAAIAEQRAKQISKAVGSIQNALGAIGIGLSITAVFSQLKTSIDNAIKSAADLDDFADKTGATVEGLSALSNVAKFSAVSSDQLAISLGFLSKTLIDAENGGKRSSAAFNSIGLSVKELKGLKPDEVFVKVALAMNEYSDGAEKMTVQQVLMGKSGAALLPMYKDMANAGDMVATVTKEQSQLAEEYQKALIRQQTAQEALAQSIAQKTLPFQILLTVAFRDFIKEIGITSSATKGLAGDSGLTVWAQNAALAVAFLADSLIAVGRIALIVGLTAKTAAENLWKLGHGDFKGMVDNSKAWKKDIDDILMLPMLQDKVLAQIAKGGVVAASPGVVSKGTLNTAGLGSTNGPKDDPTSVILKDRLKEQDNFIKQADGLLANHLKTIEWLNKNELLNVRESETVKQNLIINTLAQKELVWAQEEKLINASIRASKTEVDRAKGHEQLTVLEGKRALDRMASAEAIVVSQRKLVDVQLELNTATLEFSRLQKLADDQAAFELEMLGKSTLQVMQLTAARRVQLEVDEKIRQAKKKDPEVDTARLIADGAVAVANAQDAVTASFNKQQSAVFGVEEAFRKYGESARNVGAQIENTMTRAFQGMEDAMVNFVMTGKLNFKDLANSIIADIARIIIRQELSNALGIGGSGGSGGSSMVAGFFKSILGFAGGGSPPVGRASIVGEVGPELFIPSSSGTIVPNSALGGGNRMVVNIVESPGQGGQQSRATSNGVDTLTIMVEKIKSSIAGDIKNGSGAIPAAMSSTYGMNRTVGAF